MKINQNTKISVLIKNNPDVIDAIVSINKNFEKLRNPFLRKLLAHRVTIADAARIGRTSVQAFYDKLIPFGFNCENVNSDETEKKVIVPDFYKNLNYKNVQDLDVRNDIAQGNDPFNRIMDVLSEMPEGKTMKLINSFESVPLINILTKKGYLSYTLHKEPSLVYTFIKHSGVHVKQDRIESASWLCDTAEANELVKSYGENVVDIDVRSLEMPMPMITILNALDVLEEKNLLCVLHHKIPVFLFPELDKRGYLYKVKKVADDKVLILIYKQCLS